MSSSLLLQKCPSYLARFPWLFCEIGGEWPFLLSSASRICSKLYTASFCSSHLTFSPSISFESRWYNHRIVLTFQQLGRNPVLFYRRSDFHMIDNLSRAGHTLPMRKFTSLLVDEILLPKYVNWSTNFRGSPFNEMVPSWLKIHKLCFI